MSFVDRLIKLGACDDAVHFASRYKSAQAAWDHYERADWMLWLIGHVATSEADRRTLCLAACDCAETALEYVRNDDFTHDTCLATIQVTRAWACDEATIEDVREASWAAEVAASWAAEVAASWAVEVAAVVAAVAAARAARAASEAWAASWAAARAASEAWAASWAAARAASEASEAAAAASAARHEMCDLIRNHYPRVPL